MTPEYELALNAVREATRKYKSVQMAYRNGSIGDKEFLAAKAVYNEAEKVFDVAEVKESEIATDMGTARHNQFRRV